MYEASEKGTDAQKLAAFIKDKFGDGGYGYLGFNADYSVSKGYKSVFEIMGMMSWRERFR